MPEMQTEVRKQENPRDHVCNTQGKFEANEKFKRFEKILEEKRALITEKLKQVELYKQLEEVEEDVVNNVRDTIQKEIRELKEFTEAYEKIKASHTKEIELMKKDSVKQREDMTKIKNINLHLTNEFETKNDEIVLLKEEILINRTNFEKETSTAEKEKQKIKKNLELKSASLKEKKETINHLETEISIKNDNLLFQELRQNQN